MLGDSPSYLRHLDRMGQAIVEDPALIRRNDLRHSLETSQRVGIKEPISITLEFRTLVLCLRLGMPPLSKEFCTIQQVALSWKHLAQLEP